MFRTNFFPNRIKQYVDNVFTFEDSGRRSVCMCCAWIFVRDRRRGQQQLPSKAGPDNCVSKGFRWTHYISISTQDKKGLGPADNKAGRQDFRPKKIVVSAAPCSSSSERCCCRCCNCQSVPTPWTRAGEVNRMDAPFFKSENSVGIGVAGQRCTKLGGG